MLLKSLSGHYKNSPGTNMLSANKDQSPKKNRSIPKKQISFGSAGNFISKSALLQRTGFFIRRTLDRVLEKGVGQNVANAINYGGKALISPLMILGASAFTDEKKESIKYSMLMQPLQAGLAFASSLSLSVLAGKVLDKAAAKGTLGNFIDPTLGLFFKNPAHLKQLKSVTTTALTAVVIPTTSAILFWSLPKLMKKIDKTTPSEMVHSNLYAQRLNEKTIFCQGIKPAFGMLTKRENLK